MANAIRIKRRPSSGSPGAPSPASSLYNGELAFNENDNTLYYGYGSGVGGVAQSIPAIGGSGSYSLRGGSNATGTWPININGNAAYATNAVYTTGNQSIAGDKTFTGSSSLVAANTAGNSVGYFAVFDDNPNTTARVLKSVSKDQILDDIGAATSGLDITAGSGLVGGGTLSQNRRFDVGQGDGISVSADSIAVDNTVVRTSGAQSIDGEKSFNGTVVHTSSVEFVNMNSTSTFGWVAVFDGAQAPDENQQPLLYMSSSDFKTDLGLNNVTNDAQIKKIESSTSGNIPFWNGTTGDLLANGYSVETVLAGSSSALPRADAVKTYVDNAIVSGISTNDAMVFKGAIDCSTNPNYPAADRGWTYKVSVAGKIGGASGPAVEVNDTLICTTDGTSSGTHAAVGSNWVILQTNITDASILVTGPSSSTNNNFALFDGTTGKIIKDAGFSIVPATSGGTGQSSYAVGDILYANTTTSLAKLADVATGNVLLAGGVNTAPSWGKVNLTSATHVSGTLPVANGGTGETSYTNGQLLIGNTTGNTLTKATLTAGTSVDITNGNGSITIGHSDTSTLTGAQGSNGIASITVDGLGHVTAVTAATYLTGATVCAAIVDCTIDGGTF